MKNFIVSSSKTNSSGIGISLGCSGNGSRLSRSAFACSLPDVPQLWSMSPGYSKALKRCQGKSFVSSLPLSSPWGGPESCISYFNINFRTTQLTEQCVCKKPYYNRGVGTGPAGPATAGPKFSEPTIKNIIHAVICNQAH